MTTSDVYMRVDLSALEREPRVSPLMTAGLTYRACVPRAETVRRENYTGENKCDVGWESRLRVVSPCCLHFCPIGKRGGTEREACFVGLRVGACGLGRSSVNAVQRCCDAKDSNSCTWDVHGAVMGREVRVWVCVYG